MFCRSALNAFKVTVLGAAGGVGQPLSMLLKSNSLLTDLSLFDIVGAPGVAADLGHMCTDVPVSGFGTYEIKEALQGANLVMITAGVPRKPGMSREDLFNTNAVIAKNLAREIARNAPKACIAVITNPINSIVPIVAEVMKRYGVYDPRKLFGVTCLDEVRARTFVAEALETDYNEVPHINLIGGHSKNTIVPLLSQHEFGLSKDEVTNLVRRIQNGGDEVVRAKAGAGSATLSMGYAGAEFADAVLRGLRGEKGATANAYIECSAQEGCTFFNVPVEFGKEGVAKFLPFGKMDKFEKSLLDACVANLQKKIAKGVKYGSRD